MAVAHLIHGYIGSGKTTFAKQLEKKVNGIRFTHDEWMVKLYGHDSDVDLFATYYKNVSDLIESIWPKIIVKNIDVILDLNFWSKQQRYDVRKKVAELNCQSILYYVDCPENAALSRVENRNKDLKNNLYISENTFYLLKEKFEPLGDDEPHVKIIT